MSIVRNKTEITVPNSFSCWIEPHPLKAVFKIMFIRFDQLLSHRYIFSLILALKVKEYQEKDAVSIQM